MLILGGLLVTVIANIGSVAASTIHEKKHYMGGKKFYPKVYGGQKLLLPLTWGMKKYLLNSLGDKNNFLKFYGGWKKYPKFEKNLQPGTQD